MNTTPVVEVSGLLDQRGVAPFHIKLLVWSLFIVLIDGYDIGAISFAAPELIRIWQINPRDMGPVLSASLVGILFGSAVFGWIGDRYGRRPALIAALLWFGIFTLIAAWATTLGQMTWLRLIAGLGIGGIPNVVAINAESAPSRMRATLAIIAVGCVPLGGAIPGFVSAILPQYGWQTIFIIGGIVPILVGLAAMIGLPESIKYMALHERHRERLASVLSAMNPGLTVPPNARFVVEDERQFPGFNPAYLFRDGLALITPLLWLLFALNLMGYFFLASWMPTLLVAAKLPPTTAALAGAAMQVGGTVGALLMCRWIDRRRFLAITILFACAVPIVGSIGFMVGSVPSLLVAAFLAGFCALGIQSGINVAGALVYPTSLRANGSGWELGIGRLGAIIGPVLGALFVALPVQELYLWAAVPFAIGAVVCFTIHRLNQARLRNDALSGALRPAAAE
jgi:AAHS family 4-hydroxybenzoate transporter-like MFS transporter